MGPIIGSKTQTVQQIGSGIRHRQVDGLLRTGNHHRFSAVLYQVRQRPPPLMVSVPWQITNPS